MKNYTLTILTFISCLLFLGCGSVLSVHPISSPEDSFFDSRLAGLWTFKDESSRIYLHLGKSKGNKSKVVYIEHKADATVDYGFFSMFPSKLNSAYLANIQFLEPTGNISKEVELF